jgi:hypothetical protein
MSNNHDSYKFLANGTAEIYNDYDDYDGDDSDDSDDLGYIPFVCATCQQPGHHQVDCHDTSDSDEGDASN